MRKEKKGRRHWTRESRVWKRGPGRFTKGNKWIMKRWENSSGNNVLHDSEDMQDATPPERERIPIQLHRAACNPATPNVLPSSLRPSKTIELDIDVPRRLTGNIVTDVTKCEENFNSCFREHLKLYPGCDGDIVFDPLSFSKWGIAFSGRLKCSVDCGYISSDQKKFYQEVERKGKGRKAAKVNTQLQVVLTKHPIGNVAIRDLFASIDMPTPCESSMQKTANKVGDAFYDITKQQLEKNRDLVKTAMKLRSHGHVRNEMPLIVAQSDVAYNNPIKGRKFYQPGTQAWAPCFAGEPGLESTPIAFSTRSKVCSCHLNRMNKMHKSDCRLNFPPNEAMGNAEYQLGKDLATELVTGDSPIGIRTLVTDGDSHLQKGMQDIMSEHEIRVDKGDCTRHITRSISRNIRKGDLSEKCTGVNKTSQERAKNKSQIANFVERRCAWEFRALHKKFGNNLDAMIKKGQLLKIGIIGCIQGYTDVCRKSSLVCGAHRKKTARKPPAGLPDGKYVKLTKSDTVLIEKWIDNKLGETAIRGQKDNLTTNRSEASHLTVLKGSPKCRNRLRNFGGRAMSAVHSMSLGVIDSVMSANTYLGADNIQDCPASFTRGRLRQREQYHKDRRRSLKYKKLKFTSTARARRVRFAQSGHPGYSTGVQHPVVRHDHAYNS